MLNFEALTQINKDPLRQSAWKRAMDGHRITPSGVPESFLDGLPAHLKQFLQTSELDGGLFTSNSPLPMSNDSLKILELPKEVMPTAEELKKKYRKLAMQHHPDRNPGNKSAAEHFKRVNTAYKEVAAIHERVEQDVAATEAKIKGHFSAHAQSGGWKDTRSSGQPAASFPVEHLTEEHREALMKALHAEGYKVEEHFSTDIGCNVMNVVKSGQESITGAEVAQKLQSRLTGAGKTSIPVSPSGVAENKAADVLQKASKSGGKAKWIVGGIIAATVVVGAFVISKKRGAAEREQERQKNNAAVAPGIG